MRARVGDRLVAEVGRQASQNAPVPPVAGSTLQRRVSHCIADRHFQPPASEGDRCGRLVRHTLIAMPLVWSGQDAFEAGARVATIARYRDGITGDGTFALTKAYWHAFVADQYVLVDGAPGRWSTEAEAKAAADAAYSAYLAESDNRSMHRPRDGAVFQLSDAGSRTGLFRRGLTHLVDFIRWWRWWLRVWRS
jgi:hypothetical protein